MNVFGKGIAARLTLPVPIATALLAILVVVLIPKLVERNVVAEVTANATATVKQFKTLRGYYTKNVVGKAIGAGMTPHYDHADNPNAIPLPATMIHDLSALLAKDDIDIQLYSAHPFPIRAGRKLDDFQRGAWDTLSGDVKAVLTDRVQRDGKEILRVAVGDTMSAQACVDCHNSHPETPKTGWKLGDLRGVLEVDSDISAELAAGNALAYSIAGGILLAGLAITVISVLCARDVVKPLTAVTGAVSEITHGHLEVDVPARTRRDEIGALAQAVEFFREKLKLTRDLERDRAAQEKRVELERLTAMTEMARVFEGSVGKVVQTVTAAVSELQASASSMASTASHTNAQATAVAAAASNASANVQTVSAASEELSASINSIAGEVDRSLRVAERAEGEAVRTTSMVRELSEAVARIGDIVNLINDIASQTNLLALNATIEAARAGDAGKGFAVVAQEVKNLAAQTAKATEEITGHIGAVQAGTANAVGAIDSIAHVITEINGISAGIASSVREQAAATGEIAQSVDRAATSTEEVSRNISGVERAAGETGASAEQISSAASDLAKQAEYLGAEVRRFLDQVRSDGEAVDVIQWSSEFETGIGELDRHHRAFIDRINKQFSAMMRGTGGDLSGLLAMIDDEMAAHFRQEEEEMRRLGYDHMDDHVANHRDFMTRIHAAKEAISRGAPNAQTELFTFLSSWSREHFTTHDRKLAMTMRKAAA